MPKNQTIKKINIEIMPEERRISIIKFLDHICKNSYAGDYPLRMYVLIENENNQRLKRTA